MNFDSLYFDTSISLFCVDDKYENTRQKLTYWNLFFRYNLGFLKKETEQKQ